MKYRVVPSSEDSSYYRLEVRTGFWPFFHWREIISGTDANLLHRMALGYGWKP